MIFHKHSIISIAIAALACILFFKGISTASDQYNVPDEVIKQILQHPKLTVFFHPEVEGRLPIVIQSDFIDPNIELTLFGQPIVVVPDSKKQLITNIYVSYFKDSEVSISYPVEGVKGTFRFISDSTGKWVLETADVWEE